MSYLISNSDYELICRSARALERCRGSTTKEQNALRNLKRLEKKFNKRMANRSSDDKLFHTRQQCP